MTTQERIRNILILEDMKKNPKEVKRLGLVESTIPHFVSNRIRRELITYLR